MLSGSFKPFLAKKDVVPNPGETNSVNPRPKLDIGNPYLNIVKIVFIFFLSQLLALIFVGLGQFLYSIIQGSNTTFEASLNYVGKHLENSASLQFFYILIAESLAVLAVYFLLKLKNTGFRSIGFARKPKLNDLVVALVGFVGFYILIISFGILISIFAPHLNDNQVQDVGFKYLNSGLDTILAFISLIIFAPIAEETLMRGYLYTSLRIRWGFIKALIVTSVIFGLAHLQSGEGGSLIWLAAANTFLLSVILVYLREKTGALYASIMLHSFNNIVAFGIHFHHSIF